MKALPLLLLTFLPSLAFALHISMEITESGFHEFTGVVYSIESKHLKGDLIEYQIEMSVKEKTHYIHPENVFVFDPEIKRKDRLKVGKPIPIKVTKTEMGKKSVFVIPKSRVNELNWIYNYGKEQMGGIIATVDLSKFTPEAIADRAVKEKKSQPSAPPSPAEPDGGNIDDVEFDLIRAKLIL